MLLLGKEDERPERSKEKGRWHSLEVPYRLTNKEEGYEAMASRESGEVV